MRWIRQVMDEPLVPFSLIGGVIFIFFGIQSSQQPQETIVIRPSSIRALEAAQEDLAGRPLSDAEKQQVLQGYIDDEVLMREAFRLGLEKKDTRVRKRLLNVMRTTLDQPVAAPGRAELQAYFRETSQQFTPQNNITFEQVFLAYGSNSNAQPEAILEKLQSGAAPEEVAGEMLMNRMIRERTKEQLRRMLGKEFAERVFSLPSGEWHGPIDSLQGIHLVKIVEKKTPPPPTFENMEDYLRQDYMFKKRRERQDEKIAALRQRYKVVITED